MTLEAGITLKATKDARTDYRGQCCWKAGDEFTVYEHVHD